MNKSRPYLSASTHQEIAKHEQMLKVSPLNMFQYLERNKKVQSMRNSQNLNFPPKYENTNNTQLFTALKLKKTKMEQLQKIQQYQITKLNNNHNNNHDINMIKIQLQKLDHPQKQFEDLQLVLRESSLQKIQLSKLSKIYYIVKENAKTGRSVREILECDLMGQLEEQIKNILKMNKNNDQQIQKLQALSFAEQLYPQLTQISTNSKKLNSTAAIQRQESHEKCHKNIEKQPIVPVNQFQSRQLNQKLETIDINYQQNMDKSTPFFQHHSNVDISNNKSKVIQSFDSFQKKNANSQIHRQQPINIVQFTLGGKDIRNCENLDLKQNQMSNFQILKPLSSSGNFCQIKESKTQEVSQFNQSAAQKKCVKSPKTYQTLRNRCKNKTAQVKAKKIPNGKAIKNRVMGKVQT